MGNDIVRRQSQLLVPNNDVEQAHTVTADRELAFNRLVALPEARPVWSVTGSLIWTTS